MPQAIKVRAGLMLPRDRRERVLGFLRSHPIGVLTTVAPNGEPHGAVIYFSLDDHGKASFITKRQTQKSLNLSRSNRAMLVVYDAPSQTTAQVIGRAKEITDIYESQAIFGTILKTSLQTSEGGIPPISKLAAGEYVAYRLEPARIRMAVYQRPGPDGQERIFEVMESYEFDPTAKAAHPA